MAQFASHTASGFTSSATSVVLNKPTGLAEGDLLVAYITTNSTVTITAPSVDWTQDVDFEPGTSPKAYVFTKFADSSDVAASNFTFTISSAVLAGGFLVRITEFNAVQGFGTANAINTFSPNFNGASVVTTTPSTLLLRFVSATGSSGSSVDITGFATNIVQNIPFSTTSAIAVGWQLFNSTGATGYSASGGSASTDWCSVQCVINPNNPNITETITVTENVFVGGTYIVLPEDMVQTSDNIINQKTGRFWLDKEKGNKTWNNQKK